MMVFVAGMIYAKRSFLGRDIIPQSKVKLVIVALPSCYRCDRVMRDLDRRFRRFGGFPRSICRIIPFFVGIGIDKRFLVGIAPPLFQNVIRKVYQSLGFFRPYPDNRKRPMDHARLHVLEALDRKASFFLRPR